MRVSEVKSGLKMEIDTSQAQGFFQSGVITLADVLKGKFRDATFERDFANYDALAMVATPTSQGISAAWM